MRPKRDGAGWHTFPSDAKAQRDRGPAANCPKETKALAEQSSRLLMKDGSQASSFAGSATRAVMTPSHKAETRRHRVILGLSDKTMGLGDMLDPGESLDFSRSS